MSSIIILVPERNPDVSSFSSLLLVMYPFYELAKTIFRRSKNKNIKTWMPDHKHLHSLVYQYNKNCKNMSDLKANPISALQVLILPCFCCIWTTLFYNKVSYLLFGVFIFILTYETLYYFLRVQLKVR